MPNIPVSLEAGEFFYSCMPLMTITITCIRKMANSLTYGIFATHTITVTIIRTMQPAAMSPIAICL